jgi:hypothetical protein
MSACLKVPFGDNGSVPTAICLCCQSVRLIVNVFYQNFAKLVVDGDVAVSALLAKRTLRKKATILYAEHYRPPEKPLPDRYSRHSEMPSSVFSAVSEVFDPLSTYAENQTRARQV